MKKRYSRLLSIALLAASLSLTSCHSVYEVTKVTGSMVPMNSSWDAKPDAEAIDALAPYKAKIDSMMYRIVGTAEMTLEKRLPESLLSNLVADVLRQSASQVLSKPADMGLVNVGGLRNIISQGPITCGNIFEVLPFENSLCVVTLKGSTLKQLFENIADKGGNGVSGIQLKITKGGKLIDGTIGGQLIDENKLYTVATIDYLADGNDGMEALAQSVKRDCPDGATLRGLFMDYVEQQTAAGKKITARIEGRIVVEDK